MFSGFQSNAFQSKGYQIVVGITPPPTPDTGLPGGGGGPAFYEYYQNEQLKSYKALANLEKEREDASKKIKKKEKKLAKLEKETKQADIPKADLLALLNEINAVKLEREILIERIRRLLQEEDDIICLLYAMPFML